MQREGKRLLEGQVALVTGASAGLGVTFARVLAGAGARVALVARRAERLEALAADIAAAGGTARAFAADMADGAALDPLVGEVEAALGPVSILVNNAGIPDAQRAVKMPLELVDRVLDINVRAPFLLSAAVARRLIAAGRPGRIVNIASEAAFRYEGNGAALYSVSKAAVVRMTEALSVEWARYNINVNAIAPGAFRSEMLDGMIARIGEGWWENFPRKRLGDPDMLASTLLFLVSPASEAVTGTCIRVDDGQGAK
jgi:NAD(P)-dependent dehydrogenase (short-subunit alcohol dehydrogenase family)